MNAHHKAQIIGAANPGRNWRREANADFFHFALTVACMVAVGLVITVAGLAVAHAG